MSFISKSTAKSAFSHYTNATAKSEPSFTTDDTPSYPSLTSSKRNERHGDSEEEEVEEASSGCEREVTPVIKDPTPKQILGMFKWDDENIYDHIKRLLETLVSTRPEGVMDYFDQYSRGIRFKNPHEDPIMFLTNAVKLGKMYGLIYPTTDEETRHVPKITNPWDFIYYFEEMGISLNREELYQITLALRKLALVEGLSKIRFWGKILGLERSYIVAECDLTQEEIMKRVSVELEEGEEEEEEAEEEEEQVSSSIDKLFGISDIFSKPKEGEEEQEEEGTPLPVYKKLNKYVKPPIPKPKKPVAKKTEPEKLGEGVNKKVYYVCHEAGDEWILLPNAKPEHIVTARKIRKYFTGYLLSKVESYPPFNGTEKDFLRAQIGRISAGTQISPVGFYQFGGGEEGEVLPEEPDHGEIVANLDYDPVPTEDLLKSSFWVHHAHHILRIGRATNPPEFLRLTEDEMEEEFQEETNDHGKKNDEISPPILTPISEDVSQEMIQPWTIKNSSLILPGSGVVVVKSNLWPGAYAFAKGRIFENIYIGWGLKLCVGGFNPQYLPEQHKEYELGPEIMEIIDPTPEMEDEWREKNKPPLPPKIVPEEEEDERNLHLDEEVDDDV